MPLLLLLGIIPDVCLAQAFFGSGNWCLVLDEIQNCSFNSADRCYAAAYDKGGYCQQNARQSRVTGISRWCVVSAVGRECNYASQGSCLIAALSREGGCVPNTEKELEKTQFANELMGYFDPTKEDDDASENSLAERLQEAQRMQEEFMGGDQPQ